MTPLRLHPEAEAELDHAFEFYEARALRLGADFLGEVDHVFQRIRSLPLSGSPEDSGVRQSLLRRFPFKVVYERREKDIVVYAVSHMRQRPSYWKHRRP